MSPEHDDVENGSIVAFPLAAKNWSIFKAAQLVYVTF